jgi:glycosyltransferase involved in cell wall biosynthesis
MRAADVGVSIPSSDGSPSSVWEALACGLPLVLSDLPQLREVVGDGGPARFVEPQSVQVADALGVVLSDPAARERMAHAGRDWALRHGDRDDQIERLGLLYDRVLGGAVPVTRRGARTAPSRAAFPPSSPS